MLMLHVPTIHKNCSKTHGQVSRVPLSPSQLNPQSSESPRSPGHSQKQSLNLLGVPGKLVKSSDKNNINDNSNRENRATMGLDVT